MSFELPSIDPRDEILVDGERLRFERRWGDDGLELTRLRNGQPFRLDYGVVPTVEWFLGEMAEGRLRICKIDDVPARSRPTPEVDRSDPKYKETRLVQFVLQALDRSGCASSDRAVGKVLDEVFTSDVIAQYGPKPPAATARKWLRRGTPGGRTLKLSRSSKGRVSRRGRLDPLVETLRTKAALFYWAGDRSVRIADAHAELVDWVRALNVERAAKGLGKLLPCGMEWLRQRINQLENHETYASKFGQKAADARFKGLGLGTRSSQILELGIIDHQTFDSFVAIDEINGDLLPVGRPTVTAILDDHSHCIVSAVLHITKPSLFNALDAIKQANRPKMRRTQVGADKFELLSSIYGRFDTILPDNAWEFVGSSGQDDLFDLGVSIDWARAGQPKDKAKLERFWSTLTTRLASKLPGAVFDPKVMRELGYDPSKDQAVLLSDVRDLLAEAVAYYHVELHTGLNAQPARLWDRGVKARGGIPVIGDDRKLEQIMGVVVTTTLTTSGVCLFGRLWYNDPSVVSGLLNSMAGTAPKGRARPRARTARVRVKVKYNPVDLSVVQVYDHVRHDYFELPCREEYVRGLSAKHHETLDAWTQSQNLAFNSPEDRKVARATLNRLIAAAAPEVAQRHRQKFAALLVGVDAGEVDVGSVGMALAPGTATGMAPLIPHTTALLARTDDGCAPSGPPRRKRGSRSSSRPKAARPSGALPQPRSGAPASFARAAPADAPAAGDDDWGGLR